MQRVQQQRVLFVFKQTEAVDRIGIPNFEFLKRNTLEQLANN